jgi:hypothetical protein
MSDKDGITTRSTFGKFYRLTRCSCYIDDCQGAIELGCVYHESGYIEFIAKSLIP